MAKTFHPMGDRLIVKPFARESVSQGGIALPETAQDRPEHGEVIAVGPGRITDEGVLLPMPVKQGDHVFFNKYSGTELEDDGEKYLLLREGDILAALP